MGSKGETNGSEISRGSETDLDFSASVFGTIQNQSLRLPKFPDANSYIRITDNEYYKSKYEIIAASHSCHRYQSWMNKNYVQQPSSGIFKSLRRRSAWSK